METPVHLDDSELQDLARFFARRFDLGLQRLEQPPETGLEAAWFELLRERMEAGRLSILLARLRHRHPDDANLHEVLELLAEPERSANRLAGLFLVGAAAAALLVGSVGVGVAGTMAWMDLDAPRVVVAGDSPRLARLAPGELTRVERTEQVRVDGRCGGGPGEVVGYWYAGTTPPRGDVHTLAQTVNVREAYPARGNAWNARAPVRCVLDAGDRVRLSMRPVHVDGDRYWVPLVAGDLVQRGS